MKQGPIKRHRGRGNGRRPNYGHGHTFESNGPDVKVRGNASQVLEKYQALARDATVSGDRIAAENYLQHAEHYFRILSASNDGANGGRPPRQGGAEGRPQPDQRSDRSQPTEDGDAPTDPESAPA